MTTDRDPAWMTPDERRRELAAILAAGLRRLRDRHVLYAADGDVPPAESAPTESSQDCLEVPAKTVLSVHAG